MVALAGRVFKRGRNVAGFEQRREQTSVPLVQAPTNRRIPFANCWCNPQSEVAPTQNPTRFVHCWASPNADLSPLETMLCYQYLWMVVRRFPNIEKPVRHAPDFSIRGHVSCSFLALVLKKELEDRIAYLGQAGSWPKILADLDSLTETEVEQDGKRFLLRTPPRPAASLALRAAGVALPPRAATRRRLIPPALANHRECSAKPFFRSGFCRPINTL
jgi:hypothetical protein